MNRSRQSFLALVLGVALFSIAALAWWMLVPAVPQASPEPRSDRGVPSRVAQLEQELHRRDALIAELQDRIHQLESRERTSLPDHAAAAPAPTEEQASAGAHPPLQSVAAWLQQLLPDKLGGLTADELALLTTLDLRGAALTDADLARLVELSRLRNLCLRGAAITDAGIALLRGLPLEVLDLRGTKITGEGLSSLPAGTLQELHLTGTQVTGSDLYHLPPCPDLRVLKLNDLRVGDADLEALAAMPSIRHLELDGTTITAAGVRRLLQLNPGLTRIELRRTGITVADIADLRASHPNCELVLDAPLIQNLFIEAR
jgi:choline dehydrogenase-like flavoprotein